MAADGDGRRHRAAVLFLASLLLLLLAPPAPWAGANAQMAAFDANGDDKRFPHRAAVFGNIATIAEYSIEVIVGGAQQDFTVQLTTSASLLAIPGVGCELIGEDGKPVSSCWNSGELYNPNASTAAVPVPYMQGCSYRTPDKYCGFNLTYPDGSWATGTVWRDQISIADMLPVVVAFGVIERESYLFAAIGIDGILGLAVRDGGVPGTDVFALLVERNQAEDTFSLCLSATGGGSLLIGGNDQSQYRGPLQYIPTLNGKYEIDMSDVLVDGQALNISRRFGPAILDQSMVDTGTTLVYATKKVFDLLTSVMLDQICNPTIPLSDCREDVGTFLTGASCMALTPVVLGFFPTLRFLLVDAETNTTLELPLSPTAYTFATTDGDVCFGVTTLGTEDDSRPGIILGDAVMTEYYVQFDRAGKRVGFAPSYRCETPQYAASVVSGDGQTAASSTVLPQPLTIFVGYLLNNRPVDSAPVTFRVVAGGGTLLSSPTVYTNLSGYATASFVLGSGSGLNAVEAAVQGADNEHVIFSAQATGSGNDDPNKGGNGSNWGDLPIWSVVLLSASGVLMLNWITVVCVLIFLKRRKSLLSNADYVAHKE